MKNPLLLLLALFTMWSFQARAEAPSTPTVLFTTSLNHLRLRTPAASHNWVGAGGSLEIFAPLKGWYISGQSTFILKTFAGSTASDIRVFSNSFGLSRPIAFGETTRGEVGISVGHRFFLSNDQLMGFYDLLCYRFFIRIVQQTEQSMMLRIEGGVETTNSDTRPIDLRNVIMSLEGDYFPKAIAPFFFGGKLEYGYLAFSSGSQTLFNGTVRIGLAF